MKILRSLQKQFYAVLALLMILFLVFISIYGFIEKVQHNETSIANQNLITAADNGIAMVQTVFNNYSLNLKNIATQYEAEEDLISKEALAMLATIAEQNGYSRLAVDFPDGTTYTSDGYVFNMSKFGYLDKIKNGENFITDVLPAIADGSNVVSFLAPLHNKVGEPIAALRLTMETASMEKVIKLSLFNSEGYYYLVDGNGNYVVDNNSPNALFKDRNFFDSISKLEYGKGHSASDILNSFSTGTKEVIQYSFEDNTQYAYYQPVGINNWVFMIVVPQEVIVEAEHQNISFAITMTIQLSAILILIFLYIYIEQHKARKIAVLNDKCFRALAEQSGKVIFEWDFVSGKITAMNNFKELFGRDMVTKTSALEALNAGMVHPDDKEEFESVFETILARKNFDNIRFRVKLESGDYHWCQLSGIVVFDTTKRPYKAIGSLEDIHELVTNEAQMKYKSETDQLTGLYNKVATEQKIKRYLVNNTGSAALMIIDIDNFKNVNDSLGHQFGDKVLVDFSKILKPFAKEHNIVGRIGGDEFFLFFVDYADEENICKNADKICKLFAKSYSNNSNVCTTSASIGISFYPRDGVDFETLYKCADIALYRTKDTGKNGYTVYNKNLGLEVSSRTEIDNP